MFAIRFTRVSCTNKFTMKIQRMRRYYAVVSAAFILWGVIYLMVSYQSLKLTATSRQAVPELAATSSRPEPDKNRRRMKHHPNGTCNENTNIVFINVHQAGGSIVSNILQRFGDRRNLTFVLPKEENSDSTGWPYCFHTDHMLPSSNGQYNILCNHAVYNRRELQKIMPTDTSYVTMLRNPEQQFESLFNRYRFGKFLGIHSPDPFRSFLKNPEQFMSRVASNANERFMLHNPMAYDLGFDPENFNDEKEIVNLIEDIKKDLQLVMISDYLDESLVLLKRQMCWSLDDVAYIKHSDLKVHSEHREEMPSTLRSRLREWNNVDHYLYQFFNKTFWKTVLAQGDGFDREVEQLRDLSRQISEVCLTEKIDQDGSEDRLQTLKIPFDTSLCDKMDTSVPEYTRILRSKPNQYLKWEL
ncbi:galactose-3-O-sulfotransferase 3-like [Ptychodera flava]|uniref:galactose-3-O-sulfotransferase 3-like n=1 Tax=Ptychodera flava TaxID=63121 RepID=UPI00396A20C4